VISVSSAYAVADCGLKALGMDHGNPTIEGAQVWFCSDEHITFSMDADSMEGGAPLPAVGDRMRVNPSHIDPTIAYHESLRIADGSTMDAEVVDTWAVDLRGW
jgi:D-serine deaminase-like pyridoxal phosphate-dependent protein